MIQNYRILVGVSLSLLVHGLVFFNWNVNLNNNQNDVKDIGHQISINLVKYIEPVSNIITKKIKPKEITKSIVNKVDHKADYLIDEPEVIEPNEIPEIEENITQDKPENDNKNRIDQVATATANRLTDKLEKEAYIRRLLTHIEGYKFYPQSAQRRSIEGKINISFYLTENGFFSGLNIDGSRGILQRAARQAIEEAQPLPSPPTSILNGQRIAFNMVYELN